MSWLDLVLGLILLVSIVTSFRKGLSREVIGLVSVVLALLLGTWLYGLTGGYLLRYFGSRSAANFAGFAVVFCGVLLAGGLVSLIVGKFLKVTGLSFFDHILGAGFGILRGLLVCVALVMGIMAFTSEDRPPAAVVNSRLSPYMVDAARAVSAVAPHELREGFHKAYERVRAAWKGGKKERSAANRVKAENERQI
jgi:membrane protein required for colicin V production